MASKRKAAACSRARQVASGILVLAWAWLAPVAATTAEAQVPDMTAAAEPTSEPVTLPEPLSPQTVRELVARLSDDQVRELLLAQLDKVAAAEAPATVQTVGMVDELEADAGRVRGMWAERISHWPQVPMVVAFLGGKLAEGKTTSQLLLTVVGVVVIFAAGVIAEKLFWHLTARRRARIPDARVERFTTRLGYLLQRLAWQVVGVIVFGIAVLAAFFALYQGHVPTRLAMMTYLTAILILRLAIDCSRFLLAPHAPSLRLVPFDDHAARGLHRWVVALVAIAAFGLLSGDLLRVLGLEPGLLDGFVSMVTVAFVGTLIAAILWARRPVAGLIEAGANPTAASGQALRLLARSWHILAILYVLGIWITAQIRHAMNHEMDTGAGIISLLLIVALPLADAALRRLVADFYAARRAAEEGAGATPESNHYEPAVERALRVVLWLTGVLIFMRVWDINIYTMTQEGIGDTAAGALFNIVVTVLLAYVGWELIKAAIDRRIEQEGPAPAHGEAGGEGGGQGASRLRTLLPLARKAIFATLVVMVVMIILSSLGVDIGPLLAGAGVVGLAIGFGAQTLVRDIVSGVFFLLDDAFRVGEYIDLGDVKGTVEKISIRSMQLRHHRGALNTVPFGEIKYLTNYSRDWAIMKLEFRVTYDTDVMKVKKIFKQINADLMANEEIAPNLLEPLKSQGVLSMEDSAMIIRAKFTAKPGEQFVIRREVYARVQKAFEDAGIKFAHRQVTVHVPEAAAIEEAHPGAVGQAAGAAARRVIEDEEAAQAAKATA
jgi:small-conductance mechanosensitive channel